MAASALTATPVVRTGITDTLAAANVDGNFFTNTGREWLEVLNGSGGSINVIIAGVADGVTVTALRTIAVGAGVRKKIGPFPANTYNDANGQVQITYSAVTTVTVGVFSL